jgi:hypothetical protein
MWCQLDMKDTTQPRATWPENMATGGSIMSCPPYHICWLATSPLSPYLPHVHLADYMLQHLTSLLQIFMALYDDTSQSPPSQKATFSPPLLNSLALLFRRNLPRDHLFLHYDLELWCVSFLGVLELFGAHPPSWWLLL